MRTKQPSAELLLGLGNDLEPMIRAAGAAILDIYAHPTHAIRTKEDRSPVTDADVASHDLLLAALTQVAPQWPIVSEEDQEDDRGIDPEQPFWLVDPLDGTKEFIARTGEFSINIGLVVGRQAFFGLLYSPVTGTLYRGGVGLAAQRKDVADAAWHPIACRERPAQGGVLISSRRSSSWPEQMRFERRDALGSALKFGRIAEGQADYYLRRGPTMEWDTCAGQAIVEAAGGRVTTLNGAPLRYGKAGWLNAGFIVQGWLPDEPAASAQSR
jgi:3'(2'), 5'-bisphosphate nucleotidase